MDRDGKGASGKAPPNDPFLAGTHREPAKRESKPPVPDAKPNGKQTPPSENVNPPPAPFTEIALAERLVERHPDLRYVAAWSKWMRWTGKLWRADNTLHVFDLARITAKEAAAGKNRKAKDIANAKTVSAIERLARADRRFAAEAEDWWDVDPDILNDGESP